MAAVTANRRDPRSEARDLALEPDASYWARVCGWLPGTGYCRNRDCGDACVFHSRQDADARAVRHWRRLRRILAARR